KCVRQWVFEVIDVGLHHDAVCPGDLLLVALMKCELYVGFPELQLFEAAGGAAMERARARFAAELTLSLCHFHLLQQFWIAPGKKAIRLDVGKLVACLFPANRFRYSRGPPTDK